MAYTSCPYLAVCMEATDALSPCGPRWRLFGVLAVGGLVAWLLVRSHGQLVAASTAVRSASLVALVGCLLAIVACSANLAALEWRTQRLVGLERSFHETWRLTLGAHALDMASKSGGLAGAIGFAADARGPGRSRERGAVGYILADRRCPAGRPGVRRGVDGRLPARLRCRRRSRAGRDRRLPTLRSVATAHHRTREPSAGHDAGRQLS